MPPLRVTSRSAIERRLAGDRIPGKVFVTGAGGYLGRNLVAAVHRCGGDVRAFVRDARRAPKSLSEQAEIVVGDVVDADAVRQAMEGVDIVVHCAAVVTNNVQWRVHQETNIEGTRVVLDAARAAAVQRLVHISSVSVYGTSPAGTNELGVAEETPLPSNIDRWAYYLRSKIAAECVLRDHCGGAPEVVILRPGVLYGPGAGQPITKSLVKIGRLRILVGGGHNPLPLSYIDNVVDGILLAMTRPQAADRVYNLVDEPQPAVRDVAEQAAALTGRRVHLVGFPPAALRLLAGGLEAGAAARDAKRPPRLSRFQIAQATRDARYSSRRAREELGWESHVGLDEGLRRTFSAVERPRHAQ